MLRRQMELHPDKYSGDEADVRLARELSGRVNGAYEILRDPLKRAEYLVCTLFLFTALNSGPSHHPAIKPRADGSYQHKNL